MPNSSKPEILLVEDMRSLQIVYSSMLENSGYSVDVAGTVEEGSAFFATAKHPIILLDLLLPDRDGLELMDEILVKQPKTKVIVITANGSINRAVAAMRRGAFDFLVKPFDERRLTASIHNASMELDISLRLGRARTEYETGFHDLIGLSEDMRAVYGTITSIAPSTASVLISGKQGTGKSIVGRLIHRLSNRAEKPFVRIMCDQIPVPEIDEFIFGENGALRQAAGGTAFFEEIGALSIEQQTKLLRFLETSKVDPLADDGLVDVRLISSSRHPLIDKVESGDFREDLYYRLHVVPVILPDLADRGDDVLQIARATLKAASAKQNKEVDSFSVDVKRALLGHPWPGNVRQLVNLIETIVLLDCGPEIALDDLPKDFLLALSSTNGTALPAAENGQAQPHQVTEKEAVEVLVKSGQSLDALERALITATIDLMEGSVPQAAKQLGVSPSTLYRKKENWENRS